jgi:hypothetical protein
MVPCDASAVMGAKVRFQQPDAALRYRHAARRVSVRAGTEQVEQLTGIVFEPFTAVSTAQA